MAALSFLDRYLSFWILLAMAIGIAVGYAAPNVADSLNAVTFEGTSLPIGLGLIVMMCPPLAKVRYEELGKTFANRKLLLLSLVQNWIIGPFLMFFLAAACLHDKPDLMTGLSLVGIARCIAMVIVWNELAEGDREYCAGLVAMNSVFQVFVFSLYAYFFTDTLPSAFSLASSSVSISLGSVAASVAIYLGVPFALGFIIRFILRRLKDDNWYENSFLPKFGPIALVALLYTIILLFAVKASSVIELPVNALRVAAPLFVYFVTMFLLSFYLSAKLGADYAQSATLAFTAASNNFELAIAVAVSTFGIHSDQSFAAIIGPLVEVPVLVLLVKVSLYLRTKFFKPSVSDTCLCTSKSSELTNVRGQPGILFLCVANSARSQLAEGCARAVFGNQFIIQSAGSAPTSINPCAVEVMKEVGIDISQQYSKSVTDIEPNSVDIVVTLCAEEVCPAFLVSKKEGLKRLHWPINDPAPKPGEQVTHDAVLQRFRQAKRDICGRMTELVQLIQSTDFKAQQPSSVELLSILANDSSNHSM